MIRIITLKRLTALRAEAAQLPERAALADEYRRQAESARVEAERASATLRMLEAAVANDVAELKQAVNHPERGSQVQADIALSVLRSMIAELKERGKDPAEYRRIGLLDALLSPTGAMSTITTRGA